MSLPLDHRFLLFFLLVLLPGASIASVEQASSWSFIDTERSFSNATADRAPNNLSVPIFFHIPKSGGTSMKFFSQCLDLVLISESSLQSGNPASLEVRQSEDGARFVNVDVSTPNGIAEAHELGFLEQDHTDNILFTPFINEVAMKLVDSTHPGALFALLRHPVERAVSLFYYLQHATWEPTYAPELAQKTLLEYYINGTSVEQDWMVRALSGKLQGEVTIDDLEHAKHLLSWKMKIGLTEHMDESLHRFGQYFAWNEREQWPVCFSRFTTQNLNSFQHPSVYPGSPEWEAIVNKNNLDMMLYEHALVLFHTHDSSLD